MSVSGSFEQLNNKDSDDGGQARNVLGCLYAEFCQICCWDCSDRDRRGRCVSDHQAGTNTHSGHGNERCRFYLPLGHAGM